MRVDVVNSTFSQKAWRNKDQWRYILQVNEHDSSVVLEEAPTAQTLVGGTLRVSLI